MRIIIQSVWKRLQLRRLIGRKQRRCTIANHRNIAWALLIGIGIHRIHSKLIGSHHWTQIHWLLRRYLNRIIHIYGNPIGRLLNRRRRKSKWMRMRRDKLRMLQVARWALSGRYNAICRIQCEWECSRIQQCIAILCIFIRMFLFFCICIL